LRLLRDGWASYPIVECNTASGLNLEDPQVQARMEKRDGKRFYVRENLHQPDPLYPQDPMVQEGVEVDQDKTDNWELVRGMAVELEKHKTSKYPMQLWLSQYDVVYGRCYESVRAIYLDKGLGKDPEDPDLTFFINTKGDPLIHPKSSSLDWADFSMINGCSRITSHVARKMQSQYISTQASSVLREGREYMLCHSEEVDRQYYQSHLREKALAIQGQALYRTQMGLEEDRMMGSSNKKGALPHVNRAQEERERRGQRQEEENNRRRYLEEEKKRDAAVKPTLLSFVTNPVKVALVEAIIFSSDFYITSQGKLVDIFLTERPVIRKHNLSILLRMIHLMDPDIPCIKTLRESLLLYVQLSDVSEELRQIEWRFAWRLLKSLNTLGAQATGVECKNLLNVLANFNNDKGNKYTLGNGNIFNLVTNWQAQTMVREGRLAKSGPSVGVKQYLEERRKAFLANQQAEAADQDVGEPEAEAADLDLVEPEFLQVEEPALHPGYKLYPAHQPNPIWDNSMKKELLMEYMVGAPDPTARSDTKTGKAKHFTNIKFMLETGVGITVTGNNEKTLLSSMVKGEDTLAQFLQGVRGKGFTGQSGKPPGKGGLVHCIDEWLLENGLEVSVENIRNNADNILQYATSNYC
jgi:hypothetical protein